LLLLGHYNENKILAENNFHYEKNNYNNIQLEEDVKLNNRRAISDKSKIYI